MTASWRRTKKVVRKLVHNSSFSLQPRGLLSFFFCTNKRKTETKRKFAGYVPEAKICTFFLKKKNSLRSNSFFFFTKKVTNFFTLLHSCRKLLGWMLTKRCFARFQVDLFCCFFALVLDVVVIRKCPLQRAKQCCVGDRPHFLGVKRRCFSER